MLAHFYYLKNGGGEKMSLTTRGRTDNIIRAREIALKIGKDPQDAARKAAEFLKRQAMPVNHRRSPRFVG